MQHTAAIVLQWSKRERAVGRPIREVTTRFAILLLLIVPVLCNADDAAIEKVGGSAELIQGSHPAIRMVDEVVTIDGLPKGRVRARFVFHNEGPSTTVQIGFPASASGVDTSAKGATLEQFRSWVDGVPVRVRLVPGEAGDESFKAWYVKSVHFGKGQTRIIEDRYSGGGGGDSTGFRSYVYVLETGASWHGSIGRARLIVDASGLKRFAPIRVQPEGYVRRGSTYRWDLRNLKPTSDSNVRIDWYPAFRNVYLDGRPIGDPSSGSRFLRIGLPIGSGNEPRTAELRGSDVVMPIRRAARWLGADLKILTDQQLEVRRGAQWVRLQTGSRDAIASSGRFRFRLAPLAGYSTMVGLGDLVRALGGSASFDPREPRLDLRLPKSGQTD